MKSRNQHVLDDPRVVTQLDPSNMIGAVNSSSDFLLNPLLHRRTELASFSHVDSRRVDKVVFGGMGGSALAGDVIIDWLSESLAVPTVVVRDRRLPKFVDKNTLFVALSYSGETFETLSLYRLARSRGCNRVGVGTGGHLAEFCDRFNDPFLTVRTSAAPRAALYQMVAACAIIMEKFGLSRKLSGDIFLTAEDLARFRPACDAANPVRTNRAKQVAMSLESRIAAVYALQRLSSVARRFKNQLNENSKVPAKCDALPEAGHNDVESWALKNNQFLPVFIRDVRETQWERRVMDGFKKTISRQGEPSVDVRIPSLSNLGRILAPTLFLDYVSVYLAYLNHVDPTQTSFIKRFRTSIK